MKNGEHKRKKEQKRCVCVCVRKFRSLERSRGGGGGGRGGRGGRGGGNITGGGVEVEVGRRGNEEEGGEEAI